MLFKKNVADKELLKAYKMVLKDTKIPECHCKDFNCTKCKINAYITSLIGFITLTIFCILMMLFVLLTSISLGRDILQDEFGFFEEELSKYEVREGFRLGAKCTLYIGDDVEVYKESGCDCISSSKGFYCKPTEPTYHFSDEGLKYYYWGADGTTKSN